jgi:hypothetical protein
MNFMKAGSRNLAHTSTRTRAESTSATGTSATGTVLATSTWSRWQPYPWLVPLARGLGESMSGYRAMNVARYSTGREMLPSAADELASLRDDLKKVGGHLLKVAVQIEALETDIQAVTNQMKTKIGEQTTWLQQKELTLLQGKASLQSQEAALLNKEAALQNKEATLLQTRAILLQGESLTLQFPPNLKRQDESPGLCFFVCVSVFVYLCLRLVCFGWTKTSCRRFTLALFKRLLPVAHGGMRTVTVQDYIKLLPGFGQYRFEQSPQLAKHAFNACFAREATFDAFFAAFNQYAQSLQPRLAGETAPLRSMLQATMGAPGSGKSYFLDQLSRLMHPMQCASMMQHCPAASRHWLDPGNVLSINISFHSETVFSRDENEVDIEQAFVLRVLYSYVYGPLSRFTGSHVYSIAHTLMHYAIAGRQPFAHLCVGD